MTPALIEQLRLSILEVLDANDTHFGLGKNHLRLLLVPAGFMRATLPDEELAKQLHYLEGAGLIEQAQKQVSPELRAWKITKAGMDFVAERKIG